MKVRWTFIVIQVSQHKGSPDHRWFPIFIAQMSVTPLMKFRPHSMKIRQTVEFRASQREGPLHIHRGSSFTNRPSSDLHGFFFLHIHGHQADVVLRSKAFFRLTFALGAGFLFLSEERTVIFFLSCIFVRYMRVNVSHSVFFCLQRVEKFCKTFSNFWSCKPTVVTPSWVFVSQTDLHQTSMDFPICNG